MGQIIKKTKYLHEGRYVAEVEVDVVVDETGWSPYLTVEEAKRLDRIKEALRRDDLATAAKEAKLYELQAVSA